MAEMKVLEEKLELYSHYQQEHQDLSGLGESKGEVWSTSSDAACFGGIGVLNTLWNKKRSNSAANAR
jgi:hypothetical protein